MIEVLAGEKNADEKCRQRGQTTEGTERWVRDSLLAVQLRLDSFTTARSRL